VLELYLAVSIHVGLANDYNSFHPHARYTSDDYISGVYRNSEDNVSIYLGKEYNGFEYGLVTGYSEADLAPFVRYKYKNFFIAPAYEKHTSGLVFGFEGRF
jgi:hypothetical protein|tara:strand:+ start:158 stop:460 length:303 start_codon:yes stop_codon:yes gene_type:complete